MSSSSFQPLDDPIVAAFGDHRLLVEAIPGCLLLTTYFIVGTFGNLNIVAATVLNRKLRGTCNYLIAMASIFDSIHMHRSLRKWRYLPVHFFACASVSGLYVYLGFLNQQRTPDK
ncbi:hypothetical protein AAVH_29011 [Aphelenchoides avenae]|nr:hypothetical protein AAVH_29011 [Aphelenchus avenae]